MEMTAKTAGATFGAFKNSVLDFLGKRSTKTHVISFCMGMLTVLVSLRCGAREIQPAESRAYTEPVVVTAETAEASIDEDAACVARVLYGIRGYGLSPEAKTAVIEVILNRAEDTAREFRNFNTVAAVCNQSNQWQGYTADGEYLREDYELAMDVLYSSGGARTIPSDCFFLLVQQGEVTARTEYDGGNEWRVR